MSVDLINIGKRLRSARSVKGWSVRVLAEKSGLSQRYLVSAENGKANLSIQKDCLCSTLESRLRLCSCPIPSYRARLLEEQSDDDLRESLVYWHRVWRMRGAKDELLGVRGVESRPGRKLAERLG